MQLPDYWLTRPGEALSDEALGAFDGLWEAAQKSGNAAAIDYTLPWPKWQFLCYLADHRQVAMHGSGNAEIDVFEPRQSSDLNEFGNQKAVYAAADGLWAMFFAVVDRSRVISISNACLRLVDEGGSTHGPYYFFSVSKSALPNAPWHTGTVYLLPRQPFVLQEPFAFGPNQVQVAQLASFEPVRPIAKLSISPEDFPFLGQIRGHDDERLQEVANALQTGAPWPDDM